jgi:phospholipase/carboxylesterase
MNEALLSCVEVEPSSGPATGSVVWLHGLGADGHDFEPLVPYLGLGDHHRIRFVFPHAPRIPVTINMGLVMPAWYDIVQMDLRRAHDEAGVRESQVRVEALLARERQRGVPPDRTVLAGFSQGGAVALHTALRQPERLAGVLALSTYLVCEDSLEEERSAANQDVPMFQAHGTADPMVPVDRGLAARDRLLELGYDVTWKTYPMEHQVHPDEIRDIGAWLAERFA